MRAFFHVFLVLGPLFGILNPSAASVLGCDGQDSVAEARETIAERYKSFRGVVDIGDEFFATPRSSDFLETVDQIDSCYERLWKDAPANAGREWIAMANKFVAHFDSRKSKYLDYEVNYARALVMRGGAKLRTKDESGEQDLKDAIKSVSLALSRIESPTNKANKSPECRDPNTWWAYFTRAWAHEALGNRESALADYRKAFSFGGHSTDLNQRFAEFLNPQLLKLADGPPLHISEKSIDPRIGTMIEFVQFAPDSRSLFVTLSGPGGEIFRWDLETGRRSLIGKLPPGEEAEALYVFPDAQRIVTQLKGENTVKIFDLRSGKLLRTLSVNNPNKSMKWKDVTFRVSKDGKRIMVSGQDSAVTLYDVDSGKPLRNAAKLVGRTAGLSPDGRWLVYADKPVRSGCPLGGADIQEFVLTDTETGASRRAKVIGGLISSDPSHPIEITSDGALLVTNKLRGLSVIDITDTKKGTAIQIYDPLEHMNSFQLSKDGRFVITKLVGSLILWDSATGHPIKKLPGSGASRVYSHDTSFDGQLLAAADHWGIVIWSIPEEKPILSLYALKDGYVAMTPSGEHVQEGAPVAQLFLMENGQRRAMTEEERQKLHRSEGLERVLGGNFTVQ